MLDFARYQQFCIIAILVLLLPSFAYAQTPSPDAAAANANESESSATVAALNLPRYISDVLYVPMRSGASSKNRIVHKGLKSGTKVTLLATEDGWSQIKTSRGTVGWMQNRYLSAEPTAQIKLARAQQQIQQLSASSGPMSEKLLKAQQYIDELESQQQAHTVQLNTLNKELERVRNLSANELAINENNKQLMQQNDDMRNQLDTLRAENTRLSQELRSNSFMYGALTIILGIIITLIVQNFSRSKRRSEWGSF